MRKIDKPTVSSGEIFTACVGGVHDEDLRARLLALTTQINAGEQTYENAGAIPAFYGIPRNNDFGGAISRYEMSSLYKSAMSSPRGNARRYYDFIRNAARNSKCPLCGEGAVQTLDHYLPQSKYPDFSVSPLNLVPACIYCNKAKLAHAPTAPHDQTLHPYYDDFTTEQWLYAEVTEGDPPAVTFFTAPPTNWAADRKQRVQNHFDIFNLGFLYASCAGEELVNMRKRLINLANEGGEDAVREHLKEESQSCAAAHLNSWKTATYGALADCDWFVSTGYSLIPE